ncbi:hypothetical protein [Halomonas sp. GT]|uniref:hypothetical protein n=1 Tax=Halomonas sp. GT TaxID=1971364 RepID=UPI0009F570C2|nr:hypothetical protein [Halomonas sp. GT]
MARNLNLSVTLQAINKATGPLRQIMEGSRGAGGAIRETRDHLRNLQDQQKKLTAFRDMSRQSHGTRRALMDKREELKRITQELESTTGPTRRLTQQQERAQREVEKLSGEYRQNRDRVRELARELPAGVEGVRGFTQQQDALAKQIEETNHRLGRQQDALRRLGEANVGGRFNAMTGEIRRFGRNVTVAGGIAAGSIFALSSSTASLGDDVAKTADKMGIGTTELQQLHYAAERAGVGTEGLNSSMQRMVRRIGRAANGTGAAVKPLEQLGLSAQELNNMRPEQAVAAIADALESVESHGDKIAIMSGIMGNSGESMINMLRGGSEELEALMAAGLETGYVLSEESARGAENFQDALLDAQLAVKGVKNTIGAELMPAVTDIMREFVGWMRENREQVQAFAKAFGERLKNAVPIIIDLATGAAGMANSIGDIVSRTAELVGGFDNLAMIVGGLFAAKMILSIVMFGVSIVKAGGAIIALAKTLPALGIGIKAIGALMMAMPIGWLIAGIAAIAGAAYLIYKYWEPIKAFFLGLWQQVKAAFDEGIDGVARLLINWSPLGLIHSAFIGALDLLGISVPVGFRDLGSFVIDGLIGGLNDKLNALRESVSGIASSIMDWFKGVLGINSPSRVFEGFGTNIVEGIINGIGGMAGALRDHVTSLASDIAGWMSNAVGSAVDVGRDIANGLGDGIANATGRVQGAIRWMTGSAEEEAREDLDTHSPSRVFRSIGIDVSAGLANGIKDDSDGPLKQVRSLTNSLRSAAGGLMLSAGIASPAAALDIPQPEAQTVTANIAAQELPSVDRNNVDTSSVQIDARPPLQSHASASQSGGLVIQGGINIQVHAAPGMDEQALARLVNEQVQRALEQAERRAAAASRRNFYDND